MLCYYSSWAIYREGKGRFTIEHIDPTVCTHLVYSFAGLGDDNMIHALDPFLDLCDEGGECGYDRFTALKDLNPALVTTLSIGGWNDGSENYSNVRFDLLS